MSSRLIDRAAGQSTQDASGDIAWCARACWLAAGLWRWLLRGRTVGGWLCFRRWRGILNHDAV